MESTTRSFVRDEDADHRAAGLPEKVNSTGAVRTRPGSPATTLKRAWDVAIRQCTYLNTVVEQDHRFAKQRVVGYWTSTPDGHPDRDFLLARRRRFSMGDDLAPDPQQLVDHDWEVERRPLIVRYLRSGVSARSGASPSRLPAATTFARRPGCVAGPLTVACVGFAATPLRPAPVLPRSPSQARSC